MFACVRPRLFDGFGLASDSEENHTSFPSLVPILLLLSQVLGMYSTAFMQNEHTSVVLLLSKSGALRLIKSY